MKNQRKQRTLHLTHDDEVMLAKLRAYFLENDMRFNRSEIISLALHALYKQKLTTALGKTDQE